MVFLAVFQKSKEKKIREWGVLGGGQKVYVEKVYVLFLFRSLNLVRDFRGIPSDLVADRWTCASAAQPQDMQILGNEDLLPG